MNAAIPNPGRDVTGGLKILLTDTSRWPLVPKLALRFQELGCQIAVLCPAPGHPVRSLSGLAQIFRYSGIHPIRSLRSAIEVFRPDLVIPACDRGVQHLHELHSACTAEGGDAVGVASLIEDSLGSPDSFPIVSSRNALLRAALDEGIAVPAFTEIGNIADLERWRAEMPLPWVVKADGTWGGRGVRLAQNPEDAARRFRELADRPGTIELLKRMSLNRDRDWVFLEWNRPRPGVIAQSFIVGRPANCAVVCHRGQVLAGIAVEVVQTQDATGPATIVEVVDSAEMMCAAERIVRRLRLSGFLGFDFVIENKTGATWLIEMNPRCTPPCPLPLGEGRDLVAALWAQATGRPAPRVLQVIRNSRIAYFPQALEVNRNPSNSLLDSSYMDMPEGNPALVQELLHPWVSRSKAGQLLDWARGRRKQGNSPLTVAIRTANPPVEEKPEIVVIRN